jgi:hypothetical protein
MRPLHDKRDCSSLFMGTRRASPQASLPLRALTLTPAPADAAMVDPRDSQHWSAGFSSLALALKPICLFCRALEMLA